jgi:mannose-6-phosphate isomerase-like protein (cupin superfamily)
MLGRSWMLANATAEFNLGSSNDGYRNVPQIVLVDCAAQTRENVRQEQCSVAVAIRQAGEKPMAAPIKPIRRVVTGNDAQGRSRVLYDGPAPNVNPGAIRSGACMTDAWVFEDCPVGLSSDRDDGRLPFNFEPPERGGHLRIVQSPAKEPGYDPAKDPKAVPLHEPRQREGGTWDKGGANAFSSPVHKSETVDYGIVLEGERVMLLDNGEYSLRPGDVVVQLGNWHGWCNPREGSLMAFVMMGGKFKG